MGEAQPCRKGIALCARNAPDVNCYAVPKSLNSEPNRWVIAVFLFYSAGITRGLSGHIEAHAGTMNEFSY